MGPAIPVRLSTIFVPRKPNMLRTKREHCQEFAQRHSGWDDVVRDVAPLYPSYHRALVFNPLLEPTPCPSSAPSPSSSPSSSSPHPPTPRTTRSPSRNTTTPNGPRASSPRPPR